MGHSDRSASANLIIEQRHHAPVASQHVAEPHHGKLRRAFLVELLHQMLGNAFGGAHDARWVDRFIGRNQRESIHTVSHGRFSHRASPQNIVTNGFLGVQLHERNMFVSRSVKYDIGVCLMKHVRHAVRHRDISDDRNDAHIRKRRSQLQHERMERILIPLEQD